MVLRLCKDLDIRDTQVERAGAVELDPLAEVELRMLVPVMIGFGQGMVYFQRGCKRRQHQQYPDQRGCQGDPEPSEPGQFGTIIDHERRNYHTAVMPCQRIRRGSQSRASVA